MLDGLDQAPKIIECDKFTNGAEGNTDNQSTA